MRVLHCVHYPVFGGPHNQALRLAEPLRRQGIETVVLLPDEPGNAAGRLEDAGVPVVSVPLGRVRATRDLGVQAATLRGFPRDIATIRRVIRDERIDVVQIAGLVNPHAAVAARLERRPIVWQLLDTRAPWPVAALAMLFVIPLADVVMSTGRGVARTHPGSRLLRDRVVPFYPPVDTDLFAPRPSDRESVRAEWGLRGDDIVIGTVANINPMKGITELVSAFAAVRNELPAARLVLVGAEYESHAAYSALVRRRIEGLGLAEGHDVIFAGARTDTDRQLQGFDLFALASEPRSEGIPTALLEAMSCGVPVVAPNVGGVGEVVSPGAGIVVERNDAALLATATLAMLTRSTAETRAAARQLAVTRFGLAAAVEAHLTAYEVATGRGRRAA